MPQEAGTILPLLWPMTSLHALSRLCVSALALSSYAALASAQPRPASAPTISAAPAVVLGSAPTPTPSAVASAAPLKPVLVIASPDTLHIQSVFAQIKRFDKVRVKVIAGVAKLRCEVASSEDAKQAVELAKGFDGVVYVDDQRVADFFKTRREAIRRVNGAMDDAGVDMPEPTYRIKLQDVRGPAPSPASAPQRQAEDAVDMSPDRTIDIEIAAHAQEEENLL